MRDERGLVLTGRDVPHEFWSDELPPVPQATSVPGISAAGDIRAGAMKRVASAAGEGTAAVPLVHAWIEAVATGPVVRTCAVEAQVACCHARRLLCGPSTTDDPEGSVSEAVATAIRVVRDSGVPHHRDVMFTTLEGEWGECLDVVKRACEGVEKASPRVSLVLKADIRPGYTGQLEAKVARIEERLNDPRA